MAEAAVLTAGAGGAQDSPHLMGLACLPPRIAKVAQWGDPSPAAPALSTETSATIKMVAWGWEMGAALAIHAPLATPYVSILTMAAQGS